MPKRGLTNKVDRIPKKTCVVKMERGGGQGSATTGKAWNHTWIPFPSSPIFYNIKLLSEGCSSPGQAATKYASVAY